MADKERHREVEKKDNFFSVELFEGESIALGVEGKIVVDAYVPVDCTLNCYMKRKTVSFSFK